jgi:hypothetical protein
LGVEISKGDNSLVARDAGLAEERGLANAEWYASKIPRMRVKQMQRQDGPATMFECPNHAGRFDFTTGPAKGALACMDLVCHQFEMQDNLDNLGV